METQSNLQEFRCECGKLLFKGDLVTGKIEVKCRKCHKLMLVKGAEGTVTKEHFATK